MLIFYHFQPPVGSYQCPTRCSMLGAFGRRLLRTTGCHLPSAICQPPRGTTSGYEVFVYNCPITSPHRSLCTIICRVPWPPKLHCIQMRNGYLLERQPLYAPRAKPPTQISNPKNISRRVVRKAQMVVETRSPKPTFA